MDCGGGKKKEIKTKKEEGIANKYSVKDHGIIRDEYSHNIGKNLKGHLTEFPTWLQAFLFLTISLATLLDCTTVLTIKFFLRFDLSLLHCSLNL